MTPDEMTTTLAAHEYCCTETVQGDQVTWTCGVVTLWGITDAAMSRAHLAAVLAATVTEAQAGAWDKGWCAGASNVFVMKGALSLPQGNPYARADSLVDRGQA